MLKYVVLTVFEAKKITICWKHTEYYWDIFIHTVRELGEVLGVSLNKKRLNFYLSEEA